MTSHILKEVINMIKPSLHPKHNPNYLAILFQLKQHHVKTDPNLKTLALVTGDFETVLTGKDSLVIDDWYVYIPTGSVLHHNFLSGTNSYRDPELNKDPEAKPGYFEKNGRVKTIKLAGYYTSGYMFPLTVLETLLGEEIERTNCSFDMLGNFRLCKKYYVKEPATNEPKTKEQKQSTKASKFSIAEGQFQFHSDTANLHRNKSVLKPNTEVDISYKLHGTSFVLGNLLFNKKFKWYDKVIKFFKKDHNPGTYYDYVWSSRKVIKNGQSNNHFYSEDIWTTVKDELKDVIPKGYTLYGEIVGQLSNGSWIQQNYDYGTEPREHATYIYRITVTNEDGLHTELSAKQIQEFCKLHNLKTPDLFYSGNCYDLFKNHLTLDEDNRMFINSFNPDTKSSDLLAEFSSRLVDLLVANYNEKDCYMCINSVPEEGIVVRLSKSLYSYDALKLKSKRFLALETKEQDEGKTNLEDVESNV